MPRSLRVSEEYIGKVKLAIRRNGFASQKALAEDVGLALATVSNFLTGKAVDRATFEELCQKLSLDWQEIADLNFDTADNKLGKNTQKGSNGKLQDWGEAIDVSVFYGRKEELTQLKQWIVSDRCRLIALIGMAGIGKTALSVKLAEILQDEFEYVIWRSLRNAPPIHDLLSDLINFFLTSEKLIYQNWLLLVVKSKFHLIQILECHLMYLMIHYFESFFVGLHFLSQLFCTQNYI